MPEWLPDVTAAVLATIIAITFHEVAHGWAARALGDPTAAMMGRLSFNPIRHVDPFGTLLVPGLLLATQLLTTGRVDMLFGWAKPVPVDVRNFANPRVGMMWVAIAGPAMNFVLAVLAGLLIHVAVAGGGFLSAESLSWVYRFVSFAILVNLVLGLFNLIPVPPLDGGRIAVGLLPQPLAMAYARLEHVGLFLVLGVLFLLPMAIPGFRPMDWFLWQAVRPAFDFVVWLTGNAPP